MMVIRFSKRPTQHSKVGYRIPYMPFTHILNALFLSGKLTEIVFEIMRS